MSRIGKRILDDLKIIRLAQNWREILSAKLKQKPLLSVKLRNGVVLSAPKEGCLDFLFHEIWIQETYSPKGYEIKPNETVFDIGGNIGVFALYAAAKAPNVKIYSFEPFPANIAYFKRNIDHSNVSNVTLIDLAVADKIEDRLLHVHTSWIENSFRIKPFGDDNIKVKCTTLDQAFEKFVKCDLLKLDCEGSEYEILYSCSEKTLSKIDKIIGEYHNIDNDTQNGEGLRKFLENNYFKIDIFHKVNDRIGFIGARRR